MENPRWLLQDVDAVALWPSPLPSRETPLFPCCTTASSLFRSLSSCSLFPHVEALLTPSSRVALSTHSPPTPSSPMTCSRGRGGHPVGWFLSGNLAPGSRCRSWRMRKICVALLVVTRHRNASHVVNVIGPYWEFLSFSFPPIISMIRGESLC